MAWKRNKIYGLQHIFKVENVKRFNRSVMILPYVKRCWNLAVLNAGKVLKIEIKCRCFDTVGTKYREVFTNVFYGME